MGRKKSEVVNEVVGEDVQDAVVAEQETAEQEIDVTEAVRASFDAAVEAGSDEDDTKMAMIAGGATFKNVTRLFNQFMIDAGFAISKEDRAAAITDALEGRDFETETDFNDAVSAVVEAVKGSTERSGAALVRSYATKAEMPCYTKPKGEGSSRTSFASAYYDFLAGNPSMSVEDATAYITAESNSENVKKHASHYLAIHSLVNRIAAA